MRILLALVVTVTLAGCASLSQHQCLQGDWYAIGLGDGQLGLPAERLDRHNQACARCHGADASTNAAPAPDLRNLNRSCRRIADAELKAWCLRDNDAYFAKTVREGKIIVGVTHMPPWQGVLSQELAWAIQVFIESRAAAR